MTRTTKAGLIALLAALLCFALSGCDRPEAGEVELPGVSYADVSGTSVSGADVSGSDVSDSDLLDEDYHTRYRPGSGWYSRLSGDQLALANAVISSTDAFNAEDVDGYMQFIDPKSDAYESTKKDIAEMFDNFQLIASIKLLNFELIDSEKGEATLTVVQNTIRDGKEGKGFAPVDNTLEHHMIKRDDKWYFNSTVVVSRREVTDRWAMFIDFASNPPTSDSDVSVAADE